MVRLFEQHIERIGQAYEARVPGKLFLAGEYAVLLPEHLAIVGAIDQYLSCHIQPNSHNQVRVSTTLQSLAPLSVPLETVTSTSHDEWSHVLTAIRVCHQLLRELHCVPLAYDLQITTQLIDTSGRKYGFGSSGAVIVATIKAILAFHGMESLSPLTVFKLAAIVHVQAQLTGSLADVAANCYGGVVAYQSLNRAWLQQQLKTCDSLLNLLNQEWDSLSIASIAFPEEWHLLVGWTQSPASTDEMVRHVQRDVVFADFAKRSNHLVSQLCHALSQRDFVRCCETVQQARQLLTHLASQQGLKIETPSLTQLIDDAQQYNMAAKSSGAGGGDCGIAIASHTSHIEDVYALWRTHDIVPLPIGIAPSWEERR